jgi:hypothetical protein
MIIAERFKAPSTRVQKIEKVTTKQKANEKQKMRMWEFSDFVNPMLTGAHLT